jgi:hypothetical protein
MIVFFSVKLKLLLKMKVAKLIINTLLFAYDIVTDAVIVSTYKSIVDKFKKRFLL